MTDYTRDQLLDDLDAIDLLTPSVVAYIEARTALHHALLLAAALAHTNSARAELSSAALTLHPDDVKHILHDTCHLGGDAVHEMLADLDGRLEDEHERIERGKLMMEFGR